MRLDDDHRAAVAGDVDARARLISYLGPFVHGVFLAQVSARVAARETAEALTESGLELLETASGWVARALAKSRGRAAELAQHEENRVEPSDESAAGTEARRMVSLLRPMSNDARELLLLRLVEGIGAGELAELFDQPLVLVTSQLSGAFTEAMARLDRTDDLSSVLPYLADPTTAAPVAVVQALMSFGPQ